MNQEIKAQWVAALRSGNYSQGMSRLNQNGKLCCLGVLCEVAVRAGVATRAHQIMGHTGLVTYLSGDDSAYSVLPVGVMRWAGLDTISPDVTIENEFHSLADLNDSGEWNFNQIADLIEAEF